LRGGGEKRKDIFLGRVGRFSKGGKKRRGPEEMEYLREERGARDLSQALGGKKRGELYLSEKKKEEEWP